MAKRNVTPKGTSTQSSRYDIGLQGSVETPGLAEANPTAIRAGTVKSPLTDMMNALTSLGRGMSSYGKSQQTEESSRKRARAAAAAGQAKLDSTKAGEEWETRIANDNWSSRVPGQSGPVDPEADPNDLETHFLGTINRTLEAGGTLADALEEEARFHAEAWGGNERDEDGNLTVEAQEFNERFIPEQIKRLGSYYRDVYQAEQKASIREGLLETLAHGGPEANALIGLGSGRGREQFAAFHGALKEDPLYGNVTREEASELLLEAARTAASEGDYERADRLLKVVPAAGNSAALATIREDFESDYRAIRRERSLEDVREFGQGPLGDGATMTDGWLVEAESMTRGPGGEAHAAKVQAALSEAALSYPGTVEVRRTHILSLLQEVDSEGNYVVNRNGPLAKSIREAARSLPTQEDELDLQAKIASANKREAVGLSATIIRDGILPEDYKFIDEDGNEVEVTKENLKEFFVQKYGLAGNKYHIEYQEMNDRLLDEGSGELELATQLRKELYNATSPEAREQVWAKVEAAIEGGKLDGGQVSSLWSEYTDESQFDEDKINDSVKHVRSNASQHFWLAAGFETQLNETTGMYIAKNVKDPSTHRVAVTTLASIQRQMDEEYRAWTRHEDQMRLRNSNPEAYRTARDNWLRQQEVRWIGGVEMILDDNGNVVEPGDYTDGLMSKFVQKMVANQMASDNQASETIGTQNTGQGTTVVRPPGEKPPNNPTKKDDE